MSQNQEIKRESYAKLKEVASLPNFLEVQIGSFEDFLQAQVDPEKRESKGLQKVFNEIFPITDVKENFSLEFVKYILGTPMYSIWECQDRNMTYGCPLKATLRLVARAEDKEGKKTKEVKNVIEQDVYLGELPLITEKGTFIINGAERVIVSQLHRSPGVFFDEEIHPNGKKLFSARIIPYRGSWVEFNLDINDIMYVHIDTRRKLPATTLLRALGFDTDEKILSLFYETEKTNLHSGKSSKLVGKVAASPVVQKSTGEIIISAGETITEDHLDKFKKIKLDSVKIISQDISKDAGVIRNTFKKDNTKNELEALYKIYSLIRPGEVPTPEMAAGLIEKMFFTPKRYDLGAVGRYMINQRLHLDIPLDTTTLDRKDFISIIKYLLDLRNGIGNVDDIDHLGNRRARSGGELLGNQFSVAFSRMARTIKERLSLRDNENVTPHDLVNARTVSSVIQTFFGSSQLSQFMDQTNPLAELTHKRRLSALGPGGLTRERAGFEVRDVHHTHYGRVCPIETPEGPNIGLIASLSTYARINKYGFLETPYRKAKNGKVTDKIEYLTADEEDQYVIAQANEPLEKDGHFVNSLVKARLRGDFPTVPPEKIDYMDVSPKQLVSVAAALIPFLEHDDANRALMGSNMQRQAVPLVKPEPPFIGTGMEKKVAIDSKAALVAKRAGVVEYVDAERVIIRPTSTEKDSELLDFDEYDFEKFRRSNQDTCINQKPVVNVGERVEKDQVIADGAGTASGELALGTNVLVAFMPWRGYNFEDAIVLSERLIVDDTFTSIHIEEFELQVRDTKRGAEELTREIPNVSEEAVANLDERGIIRVGAEVEPGDILVGKVTPKGETELSPEERLLRAIFGEKAGDVKDASLKAPPGMNGVVIDTKVFSRKEHTEEAKKQERNEINQVKRKQQKQLTALKEAFEQKMKALLTGETANTVRKKNSKDIVFRAGQKFKEDSFHKIDLENLAADEGFTQDKKVNKKIENLIENYEELVAKKKTALEIELDKISRGAELHPGVVQLVKVSVATERKVSVGDKMAGRHGNKGVVAKIVPAEDMPYLPDGTPVDIILNPLGVPSRMNVGQILETHLGWAAKKLGKYMATPVFDGASFEEIKAELKKADLPESGKIVLYDGRTGQPFENEITVGYIYMMKLSHLVDDKIHARSIGPYSLV
ncbi:MAG: DNA-directed RNA polymerase subunit beta, partial [candidate division Zixibacteria bacterium RBG_16_40_9]